jgi:hypothetical protein
VLHLGVVGLDRGGRREQLRRLLGAKAPLQLLHERLVVGVEGAELLLEQVQLVLDLQRRRT